MRIESAGEGRDPARARALQPLRDLVRDLGPVLGTSVTRREGQPFCWALEVECPDLHVVVGGAARHPRAVVLLGRPDEGFPLMQIAKVLAEFYGDVEEASLVSWPAGTGLIEDPPSPSHYLLVPTDTFGRLPPLPGCMLAVGASGEVRSLGYAELLERVERESQGGLARGIQDTK